MSLSNEGWMRGEGYTSSSFFRPPRNAVSNFDAFPSPPTPFETVEEKQLVVRPPLPLTQGQTAGRNIRLNRELISLHRNVVEAYLAGKGGKRGGGNSAARAKFKPKFKQKCPTAKLV